MNEFSGDEKRLIADVDCTKAGGKAAGSTNFCKAVGVQSYPSIKFGDPHNLQAYTGERTYADFKEFADALDFQCSLAHLTRCSEAQTTRIMQLQAMGPAARAGLVSELEKKLAKVDAVWQAWFLGFQKEADAAGKWKEEQMAKLRPDDEEAIAKVEAEFGLEKRQQGFKENREKRDAGRAEVYEALGFIKSVHAFERKSKAEL